MDPLSLLLGGVLVLLILYKLGTRNFDHFSSRGIKTYKTVPFLGSTSNILFKTRSANYVLLDICKEFKDESLVGFFQFMTPMLIVKDPEFIKRVTVKDFEHFMDHQRALAQDSDNVFSKNLFSLQGEKWRSMRATLSPAFTSNKLKHMFAFIDQCGKQMVDYLDRGTNTQKPGQPYVLELKALFTRFTNDVIATTAFGLQIDSLQNKDNEFYQTGKNLTDLAGGKFWRLMVVFMAPKIAQLFKIAFLNKKEQTFFVDLVHDTISTREKFNIVRPDMIHLLMQTRKGELKAELDDDEILAKAKKAELTEDDIAAQAMIFFFAGFDTASTMLSFTTILLAVNEDAQTRLQREIDDILEQGSELTYEKVQSMKYLDMVISESLRIFPPVPSLDRECTKTYTFPSTGKQPSYTIKKGEVIMLPVYGLHHDPDYFPEPEKFDPERFSEENKHNIKPYTYMPFGMGPRLCIGQRLALLEAKVVLTHILSRFNLVVVDKTPLPLTLHPNSFTVKVKGDFWVGVTPRRR